MPDFLTVPETAEKCRVHPETVRTWCRQYPGTFAIHIGAHWRVRRDALDKMLTGVPLDELPPLKPIAA